MRLYYPSFLVIENNYTSALRCIRERESRLISPISIGRLTSEDAILLPMRRRFDDR
jgi:hypothetical protein